MPNANGWKNFELNDPASITTYPKYAILDAVDTVWENKSIAGSSNIEYRRVTTCECHVNCNTESVVSTSSDLELFLKQREMNTLVIKVGNTDSTTSTKTYDAPSGNDWQIERVTLTNNGDGTSLVRFTVVDRTEFPNS